MAAEERRTTFLMGQIINSNPESSPLLQCYGYSLTYIKTGPLKESDVYRCSQLEILVPLDTSLEVAGKGGQVTLEVGQLLEIPAGSYNLGGSGCVLSIRPGSHGTTSPGAMTKHHGKQRWDLQQGWLQTEWLHLKCGEQTQLQHGVETVAVVLRGSVSCGETLQALDLVQQPSFFSAAADSLILLIKSSLPHDMDF